MDFSEHHLSVIESIGQEIAWKIQDALTLTPSTPSAIARKVKVSTHDTWRVLNALDHLDSIVGVGNGTWRKYARR